MSTTNSSTAANAGSAGPTSSASAAAATPTPTPIMVDLVSTAFAAAAADAAAAAPTPIAVITPPPPSSRNASSPSSSHPRGREWSPSGGLAAAFMPSPAALAPAPSSSHRHSSSVAPASQRRADYHQSAGPTGTWVVPPNRKRKADDLFFSHDDDDDDDNDKADGKANILKTWPGRAAAAIFLPPSAGAAGVALANTTAARAAAAIARRRFVADRFPNPRPAATRNDKNGGNVKRRCVAQATLHHHLRPLQTCFADVDEAARGGPLGVAKALAALPGGDMGVDRPRRRSPVPVRGVDAGLPPPVGPRDGGAGVVLVEKGEEEWERERAERALVAEWVGGVVAEGEGLRAEWEEARARCPDWAELLAARARA
ncbi:hypothetical protein SLS58_004565 [Diplodia intermedia]|uniref:Uncharacterized protein n=1 Tax=Diplodia intermedia TaxID=856260 RepID=A0ABR3TT62_9PEZI